MLQSVLAAILVVGLFTGEGDFTVNHVYSVAADLDLLSSRRILRISFIRGSSTVHA